MKATGYLQIVPEIRRGEVRGARIERLTRGRPPEPVPGALVVYASIEVDPAIFEVPTLELRLDADPSEVAGAVVPVPVAVDDGEEGVEP